MQEDDANDDRDDDKSDVEQEHNSPKEIAEHQSKTKSMKQKSVRKNLIEPKRNRLPRRAKPYSPFAFHEVSFFKFILSYVIACHLPIICFMYDFFQAF